MAILGIDSCTALVSVGISQKQEILGEVAFQGVKREVGRLIPWIQYVLQETGKTLKDLEGIACVSGPGSFSGLRISLTTVQGLSLSLGLPIVDFCSLDVLAQACLCPQCWVALHSQADNYFFATYQNGIRQGEVILSSVKEIVEKLPDNVPLASPTIGHMKKEWIATGQEKNILWIPVRVSGGLVACMGEVAMQEGKTIEPTNLSPRYLRGSFAERKKNAPIMS